VSLLTSCAVLWVVLAFLFLVDVNTSLAHSCFFLFFSILQMDLMQRLNGHPGILKLKETVETSEHYILVMELMRGGDLFDRLHDKEVFSEEETRRALQQIATAVKYIHEHGIAHRDLKIENIMFPSTESDLCKVGDFGLAKDIGKSDSNTPVGTLHYMVSPLLLSFFLFPSLHILKRDVWHSACHRDGPTFFLFVLLFCFVFLEHSRPHTHKHPPIHSDPIHSDPN